MTYSDESEKMHEPGRRRSAPHCWGKVSYPTWDLANAISGRRHRRQKKRAQAYRCPECGNYHLGRSR